MSPRKSHPPEREGGRTPQASPETLLQRTLEGSLEQRTWAGIRDRLEELYAVGAIPTDNQQEARRLIQVAFQEYRDRNVVHADDHEKDRRYRNVAELLVLSGNAWPLVQTDWSIDRIEAAEKALGIRSFQKVETIMAERYAHPGDVRTRAPSCAHLHKGPGNGQLMYYLRKGKHKFSDPKPDEEAWKKDLVFPGTAHEKRRTDVWEEVGIGDRLYFSFETMLQRFVREDRAEDPEVKMILHVLSLLLAEKMGHHWFDRTKDQGSALQETQKQRPIDLNDIFSFLAHPEWVSAERLTDAEKFKSGKESQSDEPVHPRVADATMLAKGAYLESREFEHDTQQLLDIFASQKWFLRWVQWPQWKIDQNFKSKRRDIFKTMAFHIDKLQVACNEQRHSRKPKKLQGIHVTIDPVMRRSVDALKAFNADEDLWEPWKFPSSIGDLCALLASDFADMQRARELLHQSKIEMVEMKKMMVKSGDKPKVDEEPDKPDPLACIREVFDDRFADAVEQNQLYAQPDYRRQSPPLDLNREGPEMYLHNLLIGKFAAPNTQKMIPNNSCLMVSAVRSDSHEPHKDFEKDIEWNLRLLKPGGILLTDGARQSQTRIYRFPHIVAAMQKASTGSEHLQLRAEVIVDAQTHDPLSVLVQRRHPTATHPFLPEEDKDAMLSDAVYRKPLSEFIGLRPDIQIINSIRGQIIALAGGNDKIFYRLHDQVEAITHRVLRRMAAAKMTERSHLMDDSIHNDIRHALVTLRDVDDREQHQHYGKHLERPISIEGGLRDVDFYALRTKLLSVFQASDEPHIQQQYGEAVYATLVDRLGTEAFFPGGIEIREMPDKSPPSPEDRLAHMRLETKRILLRHACNLDYEDDPLLDSADIDQAIKIVGDELRSLVEARPERRKERTIVGGLNMLSPDSIHAISRIGAPSAGFNSHRSLSTDNMPRNEEFGTSAAQESLRLKCADLASALGHLRKRHNTPPITLVRFSECPTNSFLARELEELLGDGYAEWVKHISISFDPHDKGKAIRHMGTVEGKLEKALETPGLILVGGSYYDAHDDYGSFFKQHVGSKILDRVADHRSGVRMHGICFGYQTMADEIGKKENAYSIATEPGALEYCPSPVQVTQPNHPLFRDCPRKMTLAQTHSGHLGGLGHTSNRIILPIAVSTLTGNPIAYTAYDDRVTGIQAHPEIRLRSTEDRVALMKDLAAIDPVLRGTFGIQAQDIDRMWREATANIQAEAGPHILVNALLHHIAAIARR